MKSHLDEDRDAGWSVERFLKGIIRSDFENPTPSLKCTIFEEALTIYPFISVLIKNSRGFLLER